MAWNTQNRVWASQIRAGQSSFVEIPWPESKLHLGSNQLLSSSHSEKEWYSRPFLSPENQLWSIDRARADFCKIAYMQYLCILSFWFCECHQSQHPWVSNKICFHIAGVDNDFSAVFAPQHLCKSWISKSKLNANVSKEMDNNDLSTFCETY